MYKQVFLTLALILTLSLNWVFAQGNNSGPGLTLTSSTLILIDKNEELPIKRALHDLTRDLKNVLGGIPKVIFSLAEAPKNAPLIVVVNNGSSTKDFKAPGVNLFEAHLITTTKIGSHNAVVLQGADMRGTIYAIYSFSEKFLEIPPLWIWTSYEPVKKTAIQIPAKTNIYFPPPVVKWRAWFPNDKDLLSPWQIKNEANYDAIFETMLRLKLNTREGYLIDMDAWQKPYTASKEAQYVRDRGFKISFTHTAPFGATLTNWERYWTNIRHQKPPKLMIKDLTALKEFWTYHIETIKREKLDVIWQIGFRGLGDKPFWRRTFVDAMDEPVADKDRAAIINSMLALQIDLLKSKISESHPLMKLTIYNEGSEFLAAGLLKLPDEPNLILNYAATRADHYPPQEIQNFDLKLADKPIGYYLNFQFTGTGSHLVAGEGPWKMEENYRYLAQKIKKPLEFSVVNTGNVREHILELSANAAMMWNYNTYQTDNFIKTYCATYYGNNYPSTIPSLYAAYYNAYWSQRKSDIISFNRQYIFQDLRYARGLTQICTLWDKPYLENPFNDKNKGIGGAMATDGRQYNIVPADNNAKNQVDAAIMGTLESGEKFNALAVRANLVLQQLPLNKRTFFIDDLLAPTQFMANANIALGNMVEGYKAKQSARMEEVKKSLINASMALKMMKEIKAKGNHGRFLDWSVPEKNFGIDSIKSDVDELLKNLK
jgi:hypothetical protein